MPGKKHGLCLAQRQATTWVDFSITYSLAQIAEHPAAGESWAEVPNSTPETERPLFSLTPVSYVHTLGNTEASKLGVHKTTPPATRQTIIPIEICIHHSQAYFTYFWEMWPTGFLRVLLFDYSRDLRVK